MSQNRQNKDIAKIHIKDEADKSSLEKPIVIIIEPKTGDLKLKEKPSTLKSNLRRAKKACKYARTQIIHGCSQLENNELNNLYFESLDNAVLFQLRALIGNVVKDPLRLLPDEIFEFEKTIIATSKYSLGNCHELACQAMDYFLESDDESVNVDIFEIDGKNNPTAGDHIFLVIGLDKNIDPNDISNWNKEAVICDPWSEKDNVYPASAYQGKLKSFYREYQSERGLNKVRDYNPEDHLLKKLLTLEKLREQKNSSTVLLSYYSILNNIKHQIILYKKHLLSIQLFLITKYGESDAKQKILSNRLTKIDELTKDIDNLSTKVIDVNKFNFRTLHKMLRNHINKELIKLNSIINYDESETMEINAHRKPQYPLAKLRTFFKIPTKTQKNVEAATKQLIKNIKR